MVTRKDLKERQRDTSDFEYIINSSQVFDEPQKILLQKTVGKLIERNFEQQKLVTNLEKDIDTLKSRLDELENNT